MKETPSLVSFPSSKFQRIAYQSPNDIFDIEHETERHHTSNEMIPLAMIDTPTSTRTYTQHTHKYTTDNKNSIN